MSIKKSIVVLLLSLIMGLQAWSQVEAQQEEPKKDEIEEGELKWMVALSLGYTFIPKGFEEGKEGKGTYVPSIGVDVFRRLSTKWGIAFVTDLELADYLVNFNREDLRRERALLLVLLGFYEVLPGWALGAGGGIELERHKNLAILRLGSTYEFELKKDWTIGPAIYIDLKEGIDTWSASINVGKKF